MKSCGGKTVGKCDALEVGEIYAKAGAVRGASMQHVLNRENATLWRRENYYKLMKA